MFDQTPVGNERQGGKSRFAVGFIAASALWILLILAIVQYGRTPRSGASTAIPAATQVPAASPSPVIHEAAGTQQSIAAQVAERLASLHVPAKKVSLPSDLSLQADLAIKRGDFATASRIANALLARSKIAGWSFYPFDAFMSTLVGAGNDPQLEWRLHEWRQQVPDSALAYLISARYFYITGWAVRSEDVNSEIPPQDMRLFEEDLATAAGDVRRSIALNPHNPWSRYFLLRTLAGRGNTMQVETAFQQAIAAYPAYYAPYRQRLFTLTPKWGGSVAAMDSFVDHFAGRAPASSPLKLLYLQLYGYLADAAAFDCSWHHEWTDSCMEAEMSRTVPQQMGDDLLQALRLDKASDPIAYGNALWPILGRMVSLGGSNDWSGLGALLQMAGHVMGSDEQLMDRRPGHNSYVLDDIDARIFQQMGDSTDAEQKFTEALSDIENTTFPDEALKDEAMGAVYDHMMSFADANRRFVDVIAYQAAANAIAGSNHGDMPYETCYAYWHLKLADQAVKACTRLIDGNGNYLQSRYWRAAAYEQMHDWHDALANFEPIAEGANNWFRVGAAIDESVIYGDMHDPAGQLRSMNSHPFLFDPALQSSDDLATAFNNRCYAYMQLGQLHKALADCTTSLKYGHIPDAYHKQLELMARLGIRTPL